MKKILIIALILFSCRLLAWDHKGHSIIAQVAKSRLEKNVIELVDYYLKGMSWEDAAGWMDTVKNNPKNDYMKTWHYVNFEADKTYVKTKQPDLVNQIELCINMLRNRSLLGIDIINQQLKYLFHLVGDAHQPMHCGYASDKGGNQVTVTFLGKPSNLHKVWDSQIIAEKKIDIWDCSRILMGMKQKERTEIMKTDPLAWVNETRLLLPKVYEFKNGNIDMAYTDQQAPVVSMQLTKAGLRLGAILETFFKP